MVSSRRRCWWKLVGWFAVGGIALEWSDRLRPWLDRWLADGIVADPAVDDAGMDVWGGDGRLSAGHLDVIHDEGGLADRLCQGPGQLFPTASEGVSATGSWS